MDIEYVPSTERLFAAADAILSAMQSSNGVHPAGGLTLDRATIKRISSGKGFTRDELVCAMEMLVRMGFVVPQAKV